MGQTITIGYGKANTSNHLVTYASMLVTPPFVRTSAATTGKPMGQPTVTRIGSHEDNGVVISKGVEHENGAVILLQTKWMRNGVIISEGSLFFRLRANAALYNVSAKLPADHDNLAGPRFTMFSGYADLITPDEFGFLGLEVSRSYIDRHLQPDELGECYEVAVIRPEMQPRPTVAAVSTPTGVELREIAAMPARRIRLRGR